MPRFLVLVAVLCAAAGWSRAQTDCSGTPTAGSATTTDPLSYCATAPAATLTLAGYTTDGGIGIQWQSSINGTAFSNISGATADSYTTPAASATRYYRAVVSCAASGLGDTSNTVTLTVNAAPTATITGPTGNLCLGAATTAVVTMAGAGGTAPYTFNYNINGGANQTATTGMGVRYVRIQQNIAQCLNLTEMQAIQAGTGINVALGKPGTASSVNASFPIANLNDGILTNFFHVNNCALGEWVEIDLGAEYELSEIRIVNRFDCCQDRSANLQLILKDGSGAQLSSQQVNAYQGQNYGYTSSFAVPGIPATVPISTASAGAFQYNLVSVSSANGCSTTVGTSATVNIINPISITTQPVAQTVCAGQPLTMSVVAANATGYQWRFNGTNIAGATAATYTVANATVANAGFYSVVLSSNAGCASVTSDAALATVEHAPAPVVTNYSVCHNGTVPAGSGLAATSSGMVNSSLLLSFDVSDQPGSEPTSAPGINFGNAATLPALPAGATITSAVVSYNGVDPNGTSLQTQVRIGLSGAITLAGVQSPNAAGNSNAFNYGATSVPASFNAAGGAVSLTYWESTNNITGASDAFFPTGTGVATVLLHYSYPVSSAIQWYTASAGGSPFATGSPLDPTAVAGSGISNTATPGVYTFYAGTQSAGGCNSTSRTAATFTVFTDPTATISAPAAVCTSDPTAVVTLSSTGGGGVPYTFTYNVNGGPNQTVNAPTARYIRIQQNLVECFHLAEVQAIQAGTGINVASSKPVTSSGGGSEPNLTDGNLANMWHSATCDAGTWIEIDLGAEYNLTEIKMVNRQDCCQSRAANLQLILKNGAGLQLYSQQVNAYQGQNTNYLSTHPVPFGTTMTLPITAAGITTNQYNLVSVSSANGCTSPATGSATVAVTPAVAITTQPATQGVCIGQPLTLSVVAANATGYQWKKNGTNIAGATAATYNVGSTVVADAGAYTVAISATAPCGTVTSNAAIVTIDTFNTAPTVTSYAVCQNGSVPAGGGLIATVPTTYTGSFTLYFDVYGQPGGEPESSPGTGLGNATTMPPLPPGATITSVSINYNGIDPYTQFFGSNSSYASQVRLGLAGAITLGGVQGSGSSSSAAFNFSGSGTPSAFNLAGGAVNLTYWETYSNIGGSDATFPTGAGVASATISYSYPMANTIQWFTAASGGAPIATSSPMNPLTTAGSGISSTATTGTYTFYAGGLSPNGCSSATRTPATFTIAPPVAITTQPTAQSVCVGQPVTLSVVAANATGYQWKLNGNNIASATAATYAFSAAVGTAGNYTVAVSGSANCPAITSNAAVVTVTPNPAITTQPSTQTICAGQPLTLIAVATNASGYQWKLGGNNIAGANAATYTVASATAANAGSYTVVVYSQAPCSSTATSGAAVVTIKPSPTATITGTTSLCTSATSTPVTLTGSGATTPYAFTYNINGGANQIINTGTPVRYIRLQQNLNDCFNLAEVQAIQFGTGVNVASGKPVTSSGAASGNPASNLTDGSLTNLFHSATCISGNWIEIDLGQEYSLSEIRIVNRLDCCQSRAANLQLILKNGAGTQTSSQQIDAWQGQNTNYMSSHPVPGTLTTTLPVSAATAGTFQYNLVSVSSANGCATPVGTSATVTVNNPVTIATQPVAQAVCAGQPLTLSVVATNAAGYQWKLNNNNIAGATAATYTVASATAANAGSYTVAVTGLAPCSGATSDAVAVTVSPSPAATIAGTASACVGNASPVVTMMGTGGTAPYTFTYNINGGANQTATSVDVPVRYIRIQQNLADCFHLAEVRAIQAVTGTNVAAGKPVTSNSFSTTNGPANLTDGILTNMYHSASCGAGTWVEIDLGAEYNLSEIKMVNRLDCCQNRAANLQLLLKNGTGEQVSSQQVNAYQGQNTNYMSTHPVPAVATLPVSTASAGTFQYNLVSVSSSANGCTIPYTTATVTIGAQPTITTQPTAQNVCTGQPLSLSVVATNAGSYQWKLNGNNIVGATAANYTVASATAANAGSYTVAITGNASCGNTNSDTVVATIIAAPAAPTVTNYTVCQNAAVALGSGLTAASANVATASTTIYFNVYGQPGGEPESPPGISFGNATTMPALPAGALITSVSINYNNVDPYTQFFGSNSSYQSQVRLGLAGAITLGGVQGSGSNANTAFNFNGSGTPSTFNPAGGAVNLTYWETYSNIGGSDATFPTGNSVASATINYTYPIPAGIQWFTSATGGPAFSTALPMDPTSEAGSGLSSTATPGSYLFYAGGLNAGGCPSVTRTAATFKVESYPTGATIASPASTCTGTPATVTLTGTGSTAPYTFVYNINGGTNQTVSTTAPTRYIRIQQNVNDWMNLAEVRAIQSGTGTNIAAGKPVTSSGAAWDGPASNLTDGLVINLFHTAGNGAGNWAEIDLGAAYTLSEIQIVNRYDCCQDRAANLQLILKNAAGVQNSSQQINAYQGQNFGYQSSHPVPTGTSVTLPFNPTAGVTYQYNLVSVSSANGCAAPVSGSTSITAVNPVSITTQPAGQTLCAGDPLTLSVVAGNAAGYQWKLNNTTIPGATAATYSVPATTAANGGNYSVTISGNGPCGSVNSNTAAVTIKPVPAASISGTTSLCAGTPALVTLTGSGGVTPYTFNYNINGGANQTATGDQPSVRYIRIQQNVSQCLNLTEMRAIQAGTGINVAAGKPGTASSVNSSFPISNLTDGVLTNFFHVNNCFLGEWVEIDLGAEYVLSAIQVVNRYDCCQDRSSNLQLITKNNAGVQLTSQQINAFQGQYNAYQSTHTLPAGTIATLPVATASAATYQYNLVSISGSNGCTTAVNTPATVTVNATPVITTEPQSSVALCSGNPLLLSVATSGAASFQWKKDGTAIPGATTGSYTAITAAPADAGSYQVIALGGGGCNDTSVLSAVSVSPMATTLASGGTAVSTMQPDGYSLIYTDASCQPIASITDNTGGNLMGMTNTSVFVDAAVQTFNGSPYLQRHYDLTPASNGPAIVRLYATQTEFDAYNNWIIANGNNRPKLPAEPGDATGISHISVTQFHGLPSSGTTGPGGQYNVTQSELIANSAINTTWNGSYWTMSFPVSGFSGFFISTGSSAALPVELVSFGAKANGATNLISWVSASEDNLEAYEVERSADGRTFTTLGTIVAEGKAHNYHYSDDQPLSPVSYYRLRMTDADGSYRYSRTERVMRGQGNGTVAMNVFPNPTRDQLTIQVEGATAGGQVTLCDLSGRSVLRGTLNGSMAVLDIRALSNGVYLATYEGNGMKEVTKVTVAH